MEVTLKTEVEAGASGFSVAGGGNEGIFIKKVLKESPASKVFSLREGTVWFSDMFFSLRIMRHVILNFKWMVGVDYFILCVNTNTTESEESQESTK